MQYLPGQLAQLEVDDEANRRRQAQAQALQQAGFNPVQGGNQWMSLLASVLSTVKGGQMMSESDAKASEILAKKFEFQAQQEQAKAEAEAARRRDDRDWDLQKIDYGNKSAANYREPRNIDPLSPEGIAAALGLEKGKAGLKPQGGGNPTEKGWEVMDTPQGMMRVNKLTGAVEPLKVGDQPLQGKSSGPQAPKALGAEAAAKVALYENAIRDAEAYRKAVVNPDGSFNDMAAQLPANVRLRESALRAKLRAESGASISPEEAKAENDRYGPKLLSSDETNAAAANRLIEDLQHQSTTIRGGSPEAQIPQVQNKTVVKTGKDSAGNRVVMYSDGSVETQ